MIDSIHIDKIILNALNEDMPLGDLTTDSIIPADSFGSAEFLAKKEGIVAGLFVAKRVFELLDSEVKFTIYVNEGEFVKEGMIIAKVEGRARALLKGERTALNLLQRMSGIATQTFEFVQKLKGLTVKIADTRKTVPGLRLLDKYAVFAGGGSNHRHSLSDGVLIKDNHIEAAGSITKAVEYARKKIPHTVKIEVETESFEQVEEAVLAGADIIMLDNMDNLKMQEAVQFIAKRALVEASGNVNLHTVRAIAETGVDIISVGSLTHSVIAMDISMNFVM